MSNLTEEEFESLADLIAEERDKYPRKADDMDSGDLAAKIEEWLVKADKLSAPKKSDYILATGENLRRLVGKSYNDHIEAADKAIKWLVENEKREENNA